MSDGRGDRTYRLDDVVEVILMVQHSSSPSNHPVSVRYQPWQDREQECKGDSREISHALAMIRASSLGDRRRNPGSPTARQRGNWLQVYVPALSAGLPSMTSKTCHTFSSAAAGVQNRRLSPSRLACPGPPSWDGLAEWPCPCPFAWSWWSWLWLLEEEDGPDADASSEGVDQ